MVGIATDPGAHLPGESAAALQAMPTA